MKNYVNLLYIYLYVKTNAKNLFWFNKTLTALISIAKTSSYSNGKLRDEAPTSKHSPRENS